MTNQSLNLNFLSPINFQLIIDKIPIMTSTVQQLSIPGSNLSNSEQQTSFVPVNHPGRINYNTLNASFKVLEDFSNYKEVHDWMEELGTPDSRNYVRDIQDARVIVLDSRRNAKFSVRFTDVQPTFLSDLNFDATSTSVEYITAQTSFRFDRYFFENIN